MFKKELLYTIRNMWKKFLFIISLFLLILLSYQYKYSNNSHKNNNSNTQFSCRKKININNIYLKEINNKNINEVIYIYQNPLVRKYHSFNYNHIPFKNIKYYFLNNRCKLPQKYLRIIGIFEKGNDKLLGYIDSYYRSIDPNSIYIAYSIHPSMWSQGIATKAINIYIDKYVEEMKKNKIIEIKATVLKHNIPSKRVLEKNGFYVFNENLHNKNLCYFMKIPITKILNKNKKNI
ncbi:hypothetical protein AB836_00095 [Rickettsiales bacterium (ex Bugula neritina AB1)]|nr:hypothetical protein AB836_00095 [Rickettsiales bacterium (ex Bugula neritina AB1)]